MSIRLSTYSSNQSIHPLIHSMINLLICPSINPSIHSSLINPSMYHLPINPFVRLSSVCSLRGSMILISQRSNDKKNSDTSRKKVPSITQHRRLVAKLSTTTKSSHTISLHIDRYLASIYTRVGHVCMQYACIHACMLYVCINICMY